MNVMAIAPIQNFLACETPSPWLKAALAHQDILLIDHAHCEKKAAVTALHLLHRYPQYPELVFHASRLAREELRHFEKVLALLKKRGIAFAALAPSRYAAGLRQYMRKSEPERLIDLLIMGALIEARSCERFYQLFSFLDQELAQFYHGLFLAEARHFEIYLKLANDYANENIDQRVAFFAEKEADLIQSTDTTFRFHSGIPGAT